MVWSRIEVGSDSSSPSRARAVLRPLLDGCAPTRIDEVCVAVTEIIANAVTHGGGMQFMRIDLGEVDLHVEVADRSTSMPVPQQQPSSQGGRGLLLIEALTDSWGVELSGDADAPKRVWARFSITATA